MIKAAAYAAALLLGEKRLPLLRQPLFYTSFRSVLGSATATAAVVVCGSAAVSATVVTEEDKEKSDDNDPRNCVVVKKIAKTIHMLSPFGIMFWACASIHNMSNDNKM